MSWPRERAGLRSEEQSGGGGGWGETSSRKSGKVEPAVNCSLRHLGRWARSQSLSTARRGQEGKSSPKLCRGASDYSLNSYNLQLLEEAPSVDCAVSSVPWSSLSLPQSEIPGGWLLSNHTQGQ